MEIPVVLITDEVFAPYCATAMASVLRNAGDDTEISFHILTEGLSQIVKDKFSGLKYIKDCDINYNIINKEEFSDLPVYYHIPLSSYYRLKLFSMFPNYDKLIYLDSDSVVLENIKELFDIDIDNYYAGMVLDIVRKDGMRVDELIKKLQLPSDSKYFNAGLILVNLKKCREHSIGDKIIKWAKHNKEKLTWADQDTINVVMNGLIKELPDKYNIQLWFYNTNARRSEIDGKAIIHYCGPEKPWNNKRMFLSEHFWENYYPLMEIYQ
jgi:lipopolysaccharide biosynthesis glycosyltransferase